MKNERKEREAKELFEKAMLVVFSSALNVF